MDPNRLSNLIFNLIYDFFSMFPWYHRRFCTFLAEESEIAAFLFYLLAIAFIFYLFTAKTKTASSSYPEADALVKKLTTPKVEKKTDTKKRNHFVLIILGLFLLFFIIFMLKTDRI